ncbi:hypothetical protein E4336_25400 [Escherichia coli]|nr:hypothetical protein [Escherichia coli]
MSIKGCLRYAMSLIKNLLCVFSYFIYPHYDLRLIYVISKGTSLLFYLSIHLILIIVYIACLGN